MQCQRFTLIFKTNCNQKLIHHPKRLTHVLELSGQLHSGPCSIFLVLPEQSGSVVPIGPNILRVHIVCCHRSKEWCSTWSHLPGVHGWIFDFILNVNHCTHHEFIITTNCNVGDWRLRRLLLSSLWIVQPPWYSCPRDTKTGRHVSNNEFML